MTSPQMPPTDSPTRTPPDLAAEYYKAYEEHSKVLRTWLVAYGIGAPVLFLTNEDLAERLAASDLSSVVGRLFLFGVAAQVLLATLNKTVMWIGYRAEGTPTLRGRGWVKVARWLGDCFAIDFVVDVGTLILFGWATWMLFGLLTSHPTPPAGAGVG